MDNKLNMIGLTRNNGTYAYVRAIPKALQSHPSFRGKRNYRRQLAPTNISRELLLKLWKQAHSDFEQYISSLKQLNTPMLEQSALIEQAERFLRMNGLEPSMLAASTHSQYQSWSLEQMIEQSGVFDDLFAHAAKQRYEQAGCTIPIHDELPPALKVQEQAWKLLSVPPKQTYKQHIFSDCWKEYEAKKGIDTTAREGKRVKACFFRFLELVGDHILDEQSVNDGLINYVEIREQTRLDNQAQGYKASPSPASITRELNTLLAIFRVGAKRFRLSLNIERPEIREDLKPKERHTFSTQEQIELIHIASDQTRSDYQAYKELMILLMVQTGTHVTELIRLKRVKVILDTEIPHLILDGELKTSQRKRIIPLVFKVERIKELAERFNDESDYFFGEDNVKRTADNYSAQLNKLCREVNSESSSYSCRHAFKHLAYAKGIDAQVLAILGGWSGKEAGLSRQMQGYGKSGLMNQESLIRLQKAMFAINEHLIQTETDTKKVAYLKIM